jgi:dTDP-4-dehydrorhamnose reductase
VGAIEEGGIMRILITGADGQLGRELVEVFGRSDHHEVTAAGRTQLDLASRDSVLGAITTLQPEAIVHAGAFTAVDRCEEERDTAYAVNAMGTRHVADGARRVGAQVFYVSTDYVFDGDLDRPYNEWDATNPQSIYGLSKLGGEHELNDGDTIIRTSWVFGQHGANMVKTVLRLLDSHPTLSFVDDQHGKPTSAADLAEAIAKLVVGRIPGTFHLTNEGATTWFQFVRDIAAASGADPERVQPIPTSQLQPPRPAKRPANSVLDNAAWRALGFAPMPDHRDALGRVLAQLHS